MGQWSPEELEEAFARYEQAVVEIPSVGEDPIDNRRRLVLAA